MSSRIRDWVTRFLMPAVLTAAFPVLASAGDGEVSGTLSANGEAVELPHVYVWKEDEGLYDPADPTWKIFFVGRALSAREIGDWVWDAAWVEVGLTQTAEFSEDGEPRWEVYTQNIRFSADAAGNISGGEYPQFDVQGLGTGEVSGRIWHDEEQEFFDDRYQYDFTFSATAFDPNAPIGEPLPAGGGEPGAAYLKWSQAIHGGDIEAFKQILPADLVEQIESATPEEVAEQMAFLKFTTPQDVQVIGGSIDGEEAYLQVTGTVDGEPVEAQVTMTRFNGIWMPTETSI